MKAQMYNYSIWIDNTDPYVLSNYFNSLLKESGFNIENFIEKHFEPIGYTALYLLSESHLAIHTFPEEKKTYIELSSCVSEPFNRFIKSIKSL